MPSNQNEHNKYTIELLKNSISSIKKDDDYAVNFVDCILRGALELSASDLHLECLADKVNIKMRFDGSLHLICEASQESKNHIITRIKYLSKLAVYQTNQPQDGRINYQLNGSKYDLRTSFLPTIYGEKVVIRFPEKNKIELDINSLGMPEKIKEQLLFIARKRQGLLLLTGPSSSGKTTTIYSLLKHIYHQEGEGINIATIEDPVEYPLGFLSQTQVNPAQELTYANGLKSILRQDPDIIMIGEIRDAETAIICIQSSLAGHLVISTIHSNQAVGVFLRLINMEIEPFLIASSIQAVLSQRLIRKLCNKCKTQIPVSQKIVSKFNIKSDRVFFPKGCSDCNMTGYSGRTGIFEIITMTEQLEQLILSRSPVSDFTKYLNINNIQTFLNDGIKKIEDGITSVEEILKTLGVES